MKKQNTAGFTLIEMMVVVLIIGILAAIALPQYRMAVTKAKVAAILPLMRAWKDALMEYKLTNGDYNIDPLKSGNILGVSWPSDWDAECINYGECYNDYWSCFANEEFNGMVYCGYGPNHDTFSIYMYQPDEENYPEYAGMMTCAVYDSGEGHKVCKALGGKQLNDWVYQL